jgi:hypothetical protein
MPLTVLPLRAIQSRGRAFLGLSCLGAPWAPAVAGAPERTAQFLDKTLVRKDYGPIRHLF